MKCPPLKKITVKVLQLEWWMIEFANGEISAEGAASGLIEICPRLMRDGYYCIRPFRRGDKPTSWFECNGKAWTTPHLSNYFMHDLAILNHRQIRNKELSALLILSRAKLLNRQMEDLLHMELHVRELRAIRRNTGAFAIKYMNEFGESPQ